jgi:glycosyltransferase EpsH
MPNEPLVSVIVPAYNAEQTLEKCINSLTAQIYRNLEVIIVNDCSTDGTLALAQRLAAADERVKVCDRRQNGGLSQARNSGMEQAVGHWFVFVDSDDWIEPETVETAVSAAQKNNADLVVWSYVSEYGESKKEKHIYNGDRVMPNGEMLLDTLGPVGERLAHPEFIHSLSTVCTKLFRANLIRENQLVFYDLEKIGAEDLYFSAQYCSVCPAGKSVYLDRCFYHYIKANTASLSGRYKANYTAMAFHVNTALEELCAGRENADECRAALRNRWALCLINIGLNEMAATDGRRAVCKRLKKVLNEPPIQQALRQLDFHYLPLKWKVFFLCARLRFVTPFYYLLRAMQKLIARHD